MARLLLFFFFEMDHFKSLSGVWTPGMQDLSSPTRDQTHTSCIGRQSLNHQNASEVPGQFYFKFYFTGRKIVESPISITPCFLKGLYTCNYVTMAFLSIFLVEGTKALRERMVLKSWNKVMAELTYDPWSLDIQFNILCVASLLIKRKKKKINGTKNHPA